MIVIRLREDERLSGFLPIVKWQFRPWGTGTDFAWGSGQVLNRGDCGGDSPRASREPGSRCRLRDPDHRMCPLSACSLGAAPLGAAGDRVRRSPLFPLEPKQLCSQPWDLKVRLCSHKEFCDEGRTPALSRRSSVLRLVSLEYRCVRFP